MQTKISKAVVLLSGGQDSTTCLYWAIQQFKSVLAVGFYYGQTHKIELARAKAIAEKAGVPYETWDLSNLFDKSESSLVKGTDHSARSYFNADLPASFVPGRNLLFLTLAAMRAADSGASDLVTGVCQTDYSGYPDCRRTTINAVELALSLGLGAGDIRIHTPMMYLSKAETWKMAKELGILDIIIKDTMTDYDGSGVFNEWGYGTLDNPASKLRAKGYYEAKQKGWLGE